MLTLMFDLVGYTICQNILYLLYIWTSLEEQYVNNNIIKDKQVVNAMSIQLTFTYQGEVHHLFHTFYQIMLNKTTHFVAWLMMYAVKQG